jgi:hypothetical protein
MCLEKLPESQTLAPGQLRKNNQLGKSNSLDLIRAPDVKIHAVLNFLKSNLISIKGMPKWLK